MTLKGTQPVILNGQRVMVVTESNKKPRYIPDFVWRWMVRVVVRSQKVTVQVDGIKPEGR